MRPAKTKLLVIAVSAGLGLSGLIHVCDERLLGISRQRAERPARLPNALAAEGRDAAPARAVPRRIALFSAAAVEIIFALGEGARIAGVTRFATYPDEATSIPDIGGLVDVNFERLVSLNPDLIVAQTASEKIGAFAAERRIPFMALEIETIGDVLGTIRALGAALGSIKAAEQLVNNIERDLSRVRSAVKGRPRVSCFVSVDRSPGQLSSLLSIGRGSFLAEILEIAGGRNVFDDLTRLYPVVSKEALVARAPEVVLEFKPGAALASPGTRALVADWQLFRTLPAVRHHRIYVVNHPGALMPGPRVAKIAQAIASYLHPLAFTVRGANDAR